MRIHRLVTIVALAAMTLSSVGVAQTRGGPRKPLTRATEIAFARSAAPAAISSNARIWIWSDSGYVVGDSGTSLVNCYLARPWDVAYEPHCFDEEASRTIMPIQMRKMLLFRRGKTDAEVDREIADSIASGHFRLPQRPAMTYMMSAAQELVNGQGVSVGAWLPHLMIFYPNLTSQSTGVMGFVPGVGFIENPGQALSTLVVPVREAVPAPEAAVRELRPPSDRDQ